MSFYENYFKISWRFLVKSRITSIINLLGLSLGIVVCFSIYLVLSNEFSYDKFHPDSERIYRIIAERVQEGKEIRASSMLSPMAPSLREELTMTESVTGFYNLYIKKVIIPTYNGEKEFPLTNSQKHMIVADPHYFSIFHYHWLCGSPTDLNLPNYVVLTLKQAIKYFGEMPVDSFLGRDIIYQDEIFNASFHMTVSGIVQDWESPTDFGFTDFISMGSVYGNSVLKRLIGLEDWDWWYFTSQVFVQLVPGVSPSEVEHQLAEWQQKHLEKEENSATTLLLQPLKDLHFDTSLRGDAYSRQADMPTLRIALFIALFVLLIAVLNFINLATAQAFSRAREVGIRKIFGETRTSITLQLLYETSIVAFVATLMALLTIRPVLTLMGTFVTHQASLDLSAWTTWVFLVVMLMIVTLSAGIYPAIMISSTGNLQDNVRSTTKSHVKGRVRTALIVFQFTLTLFFIATSIVVRRQVQYMQNEDLGFRKEGIMVVNSENQVVKRLFEELKEQTYVDGISLHRAPPALYECTQMEVECKSFGEPIRIWATVEPGDEHFIPLYEMELVAGRNFMQYDNKDLIINETCAKLLGFSTPDQAIGSFIEMRGDYARASRLQEDRNKEFMAPIVGVIKDFHLWPKHRSITPYILCNSGIDPSAVSVRLFFANKRDWPKIITELIVVLKEINPDTDMDYYLFEDLISNLYTKERDTLRLINVAIVLTIFISCMGLFGLTLFTSKQRTKEIGIRKVVGASSTNVFTMLVTDSVRLVGIAMLIAFPLVAYFTIRWLQGFAYHISLQVWMFVLAAGFTLVLTLCTVGWHAIKASKTNPIETIKME